ncbi:LacI family DNA-binding transcriptional regulator [Eisenbergiella sp.]|uniref:LacI family DNA-binding transcriptional regulator n=1 Tax=Eisenbergiella sp. TaxID=1924109 RepID=UPI0020849EA7|nr:LacI family DNA-binding transcriptional regulator [Eisenbergiella sp.]BDF47328.1 LacI family transcriptional regulator [Lachnospiraceae bacterium]GKH43403.1 LacI family transcriptional regulator [Lachnospiraceae bacterium]
MVTRKEVARKVGVSVSVVSRAMNNSGYVEAEKKKRILEVADKLGYYPHPVAEALQKRRTKQLLFFCKDLRNSFYIDMYQGMVEAAGKRDYMMVFNGSMDFENIRNTMIDGIIMPNEVITRHYLDTVGKNYRLPVVSASYGSPVRFSRSVPRVEIDMEKVMELAVKELRANGHRRLALAMPYPFRCTDVRRLAFCSLMEEVYGDRMKDYYIGIHREDLAGDSRILAFLEEEERENGMRLLEEDFFGKGELAAQLFVERKIDATAVVAFNDEFALGMCKRFHALGIRVPRDISLIGIDGSSARKYQDPCLTSVGLFPEKQGAKCVNVLLDMLEGKKVKYISGSPVKLVKGESVKKLD